MSKKKTKKDPLRAGAGGDLLMAPILADPAQIVLCEPGTHPLAYYYGWRPKDKKP